MPDKPSEVPGPRESSWKEIMATVGVFLVGVFLIAGAFDDFWIHIVTQTLQEKKAPDWSFFTILYCVFLGFFGLCLVVGSFLSVVLNSIRFYPDTGAIEVQMPYVKSPTHPGTGSVN